MPEVTMVIGSERFSLDRSFGIRINCGRATVLVETLDLHGISVMKLSVEKGFSKYVLWWFLYCIIDVLIVYTINVYE